MGLRRFPWRKKTQGISSLSCVPVQAELHHVWRMLTVTGKALGNDTPLFA